MLGRIIHAPTGRTADAAEKKRIRDTQCEIGQLRLTAREIAFPKRLHTEFIRYDEIVWAYIRIERDTAPIGLGYTSVSVSYLVLRVADGREFVMGLPTDQKADEALHLVGLYAEGARIGHTEENCAHFGVEKKPIDDDPGGIAEIPIWKKKL